MGSVEAASAGGPTLESVFRKHYPSLCVFVEGYVQSPEVASDIVQGLFVSLCERAESHSLPSLTAAYLYRACRNRALNHLRHRRVVHRWAEQAARAPGREPDQPDHLVREGQLQDAIREAINDLPERRREIFLLSREQDLTYAAIAELLGVSIKTVETQMWRALKALRVRLAPFLRP